MAAKKTFNLDNFEYRLRESVGGRGEGTLLFEKRPSGSIEAYFLYKLAGKETKIKIGQYKKTRTGHGYTGRV
ncbi:hypothetical protein [Endozoicomonas sp. ONNA2]|uniref:hypothetical protein n=1 Tax=Endozoicomonas sp. ONNA2 TaxID=2828741 RepID=UPI0021474951|nr:hypothetical protein [Endozoicomonas sp. ONNA2]